ncbi:MAG TPA: hypothetical protein VEZ70_07220 [Allosphingosinicella sp.]|nr:hypothetical protein [Allosphingosinicella sp.]
MLRDRKKLIAALVVGALVLAWVGVIGASLLLDLSKAQKVAMVVGLAVATEIALWVGGVLLGITAFARMHGWMRLRWSGKERNGADSKPKAG